MGLKVNIRPPMMLAGSDADKLKLLHSYLFQMTEQLNYALEALDRQSATVLEKAGLAKLDSRTGKYESTGKLDDLDRQFTELRSLIIKTATEVKADYDVITQELASSYVAKSGFGEYAEKTLELSQRFAGVEERVLASAQEIFTSEAEFSNFVKEQTDYIRFGYGEYDAQGFRIPQIVVGAGLHEDIIDGETYVRGEAMYAAFQPDRLSFYMGEQGDSASTEVAYFSQSALHVNNVDALGHIHMAGDWEITPDPEHGLTFKWIGGEVNG